MTSRIFKELYQTFELAVPLIAALVAQLLIEIINTIMLGKLGKAELAAGSLGIAALFFLLVICVGLFSATGVLIARGHGGNQFDEIKIVLNQSFYLAFIFCVPCIFALWNLPWVLIQMGLQPTVIDLTAQFLHSLVWGIPPLLVYFVLREFVTALSYTKIIMLLTLSMAPFTALLNYILIYGKWGFPALGIAGIGYSTSLMQWLFLMSMFLYIFKNKKLHTYFVFRVQFIQWKKIVEIVRLGLPVSVTMALEVGLFSMTTFFMGYFGVNALAAHQIALQCASFIFMFPLGISQATAIRVGQAIGGGSRKNAKYAGFTGLLAGMIVVVLTAVLFLCFTTFWISLFIDMKKPDHDELIRLAVHFLHVFVFFQAFDALQVITSGALRGLKDTFVPMFLGLLSYWIVGLSSGYYFAFQFHAGAVGLWWGLAAGITVSGVILFLRFLQKIN